MSIANQATLYNVEFHSEKREYIPKSQRISDVGLVNVQNYLYAEWREGRLPTYCYADHLNNYIGSEWIRSKGDYTGTFPKRLAKWYKKSYNHKLTQEQLSTIGTIASKDLIRDSFTLDFDPCPTRWRSPYYGNQTSCYYTFSGDGNVDRRGAPQMIEDNGGYGIRFYLPDGTYGRCWIAQCGDVYVLWNIYGNGLTLPIVARLLGESWGLENRKIDLKNNGDDCGILYINSGGYALGSKEALAALGEESEPIVDLGWDDVEYEDENTICCDGCRERIDIDGSYSDECGNSYCESCFSDSYCFCDRCGSVVDNDDILSCGDNHYCESCAARAGYRQCDECEEYHRGLTETQDELDLCESCLGDTHTCCEDCGEYCPDREREEIAGEFFCQGCVDDHRPEEEEEEEVQPLRQYALPLLDETFVFGWSGYAFLGRLEDKPTVETEEAIEEDVLPPKGDDPRQLAFSGSLVSACRANGL